MKIYSFNVNGLNAFESYTNQYHSMSLNDYFLNILKADILSIQETKGSQSSLSKFTNLKDYKTFFSFNKIRNGHSGVCLVIRKTLHLVNIYNKIDSMQYASDEGRIIMADFGTFKVLNLYFPFLDTDTDNLKHERMKMFYDGISTFLKDKSNMIVCGDFNAVYKMKDHYQYNTEIQRIEKATINKEQRQTELSKYSIRLEKRSVQLTELPFLFPSKEDLYEYFLEKYQRKWFVDFISTNNYIDCFDYFYPNLIKYSCWNAVLRLRDRNLGSRIDYVMVSRDLIGKVKHADVLDTVYGSDHCPVAIDIDLECKGEGENLIEKRTGILSFVKRRE